MFHCIAVAAKVWLLTMAASLVLAGPLLILPVPLTLPTVVLQFVVVAVVAVRVPFLREGLATGNLRAMLPWITAGAASTAVIAPNLAILSELLLPAGGDEPNPLERLLDQTLGFTSVFIFSVVLAPFWEELLVRGWLQREVSLRFGVPAGIIGSSMCFALLHLTPSRIPYYFVTGLLFGGAFALTRTIWAGLAFHAAYNGSLFGVSALFPTRADFVAWVAQPISGAVDAVLLMLALALGAVVFRRLRALNAPALPSTALTTSTDHPALSLPARADGD